ncbi:hypothetical protein, partial [uncultured Duncaniella sp.]|uniref:hypothetical protein n=1 Tax=uncultured Duncaniella sp. TaxID=2768039 RepID=UPI00266C8A2F
ADGFEEVDQLSCTLFLIDFFEAMFRRDSQPHTIDGFRSSSISMWGYNYSSSSSFRRRNAASVYGYSVYGYMDLRSIITNVYAMAVGLSGLHI